MSTSVKFADLIAEIAKVESTASYRVHLTTGEDLSGKLSIKNDSDYIEVTRQGFPVNIVRLEHIVYIARAN